MPALKWDVLRHTVSSQSAATDLGMNRTQLIKLCDALVLALLVGIFTSFSWVAGLIVAVVGFWLAFVFKPRRYARSKLEEAGLARCRRVEREVMTNPSDPLSPGYWEG